MVDSVIGAAGELLMVQQDCGSLELSTLPCCCACMAIIGQSGGQCIEVEPAECGAQSASESDGANKAISTKLAETNLYQIRILSFNPL